MRAARKPIRGFEGLEPSRGGEEPGCYTLEAVSAKQAHIRRVLLSIPLCSSLSTRVSRSLLFHRYFIDDSCGKRATRQTMQPHRHVCTVQEQNA